MPVCHSSEEETTTTTTTTDACPQRQSTMRSLSNDREQLLPLPPYKGFCLVTRRVLDTQLTSTAAYKRLSKVGSISILAQAWLESCPVSLRVQLGERAQSGLLMQLTSTLASLAGVRLRPQHLAVSILDAICELVDSIQLDIHSVAGRELARSKVFELLYRIQARAAELLDLLSALLRLVAATKLPLEFEDADEDELPYWTSPASLREMNDEEAFKKLHFADVPRIPFAQLDMDDDDAESLCSSDDDDDADEYGSQPRSFYHHSDSSIRRASGRGRSLDDDLHTIRRPPDEDRRNSSPSTCSRPSRPSTRQTVNTTTFTTTRSPTSRITPTSPTKARVPVGLAMPRYITGAGKPMVEPAYRLDELLSTVTATFPDGLESSLEIQLDRRRSYTMRELAALRRHYGKSLEPLSDITAAPNTGVLRHDGARWQVTTANDTTCT